MTEQKVLFDSTPAIKHVVDKDGKIKSEVKENEIKFQLKISVEEFLFSTPWFFGTQETAQAVAYRLSEFLNSDLYIKKIEVQK